MFGIWESTSNPILWFLTIAIAVKLTSGQTDDDAILMFVQFESSSDIPDQCQDELVMPAQALSGQNASWENMCGNDYFDDCSNVLDYIFRMEYTDEERMFVIGVLNAFAYAGAEFACNISKQTIEALIVDSGERCFSDRVTAINYCSYVSVVRFDTSQPLESICRGLDYAFDCNMEAIRECNIFGLTDLWESYYKYVIVRSPCNKYSKWGNIYPVYSSAHNYQSDKTINIVTVISLLALRFVQRLM